MQEKDRSFNEQPSLETAVSILIPAYNEALGIKNVLPEVIKMVSEQEWDYEIVVIDDGSEDDTAAAARSIQGTTVLKHEKNRGYGASIKTGIRHSKSPLICIVDGDGTYPIDRIPALVQCVVDGGVEMAVGMRAGKRSGIPLLRRPAKWVIRQLATLVAGERIPDLNSGLRVFKRSVALRFFPLFPDGFSFTTTLTLGMLTNGFLIDYVPIEYLPRLGKSKIRPLQDTLGFIRLVVRIALYFEPMKIFMPLSIFLMAIALGWGFFSALVLGKLADVSTSVLVLASVQSAVIGMLADLINRRFPNYHKDRDQTDSLNE